MCPDTSRLFMRSVSLPIYFWMPANFQTICPHIPTISSWMSMELQVPSTTRTRRRATINLIIVIMKMRTASGKKHRQPLEQKPSQEPVTPRMKKSYSVTKTTYLQLQLDASGKKRGNLQRNLTGKEKRISELERELREYQEVIVATGGQMRELKGKYEHERTKGQRAQQELRDAVQLCRDMKQKCQELIEQNEALKASETEWRLKAQVEEKKTKELRELRKREKREIKQIMTLVLNMKSSSEANAEEVMKVFKML